MNARFYKWSFEQVSKQKLPILLHLHMISFLLLIVWFFKFDFEFDSFALCD